MYYNLRILSDVSLKLLAVVGLGVAAIGICWFTGGQSASAKSPVLLISMLTLILILVTSDDNSSRETDET